MSSFVLDISVSIDDRPQVTEEYDRIKTQRVSEAVMLKNISKIADPSKRCVQEYGGGVCEGGGWRVPRFRPGPRAFVPLSKQKKTDHGAIKSALTS